MRANYSTAREKSSLEFSPAPLPLEIVAELEADHRRELRKLSDLAFVFLEATNGDRYEAEKLLDDAVDLLFEGGALSMWRYRIVLAAVREGL
jgi:hypothetical protein